MQTTIDFRPAIRADVERIVEMLADDPLGAKRENAVKPLPKSYYEAFAHIVDDPNNSSRMIKYTSLEGPEAAIYVRGTANLVSGQGQIEFPDHFSVMAVPSSITVSLTPRSASSMGLAAVSVSSQGIDVAELGGGTNSYSFDYVAYAVRKGFEDFEVYLTQEQVVRLTGQAQAQAQAQTLELRPRSLLTASPLTTIQRQE